MNIQIGEAAANPLTRRRIVLHILRNDRDAGIRAELDRWDVLLDELRFQQALASGRLYRALPRGPVHGDLSRDNVLFASTAGSDNRTGVEKLSGFFDFYFAGTDVFI
ncbi:phosphotransferase [Paraburkholderia sp. JPY419]|uniref:phosphotransferase n=1 Tax=Paraburkholderia sp. JPY419 TaxID=667660 RepID=UPI003D245FBE